MSNYDLIAIGDSLDEHSPGPLGGEVVLVAGAGE
jgi:hypothetical protein